MNFVDEWKESGPCIVNMDKLALEDWQPKINYKKDKIVRDAFITKYKDQYKLAFVRRFNVCFKMVMDSEQAKAFIELMGLTERPSPLFKHASTFRLCWYWIDWLEEAGMADKQGGGV